MNLLGKSNIYDSLMIVKASILAEEIVFTYTDDTNQNKR